MLDAAAQDLRRLRRIAGVVAKYGYRTDKLQVEREEVEGVPPPDLTGPRKMRLMLEELGPTFIKLGQVLSTRPDLVSPAYVVELKQLQAECTALDYAEIEAAGGSHLRPDRRLPQGRGRERPHRRWPRVRWPRPQR